MENILKYCIPTITEKQRERAVKVFMKEGTSFAILDGALYMSPSSLELFNQKHDHIWHGHLDI